LKEFHLLFELRHLNNIALLIVLILWSLKINNPIPISLFLEYKVVGHYSKNNNTIQELLVLLIQLIHLNFHEYYQRHYLKTPYLHLPVFAQELLHRILMEDYNLYRKVLQQHHYDFLGIGNFQCIS